MTVPYAADVPPRFSSSGWAKAVVFRWVGGIYKLLIHELVVYLLLWYATFAFSTNLTFGVTSTGFDGYIKMFRLYQGTVRVMLGFMLVYYYQEVYARARRIFFAIPFPDSTFIAINSLVDSSTARGQVLKRTIFRYILATTFQSYHASSTMFRHAYPRPWNAMQTLGLLTDEEIQRLRSKVDNDYPYYGEVSFVPMAWATMALRRVFEENLMIPRQPAGVGSSTTPSTYPTVINIGLKALHDYRGQYGSMLFEVYFPFPLYLSQLVTVVTYSYFAVALVAQQNQSTEPPFYFPFFTFMEFFVYVGALRVGQTFTNPLGEDECCFEMVAFFNRNLRLAHIYGGFGSNSAYDMVRNPLPVVDLSALQQRSMSQIPLNFYHTDVARTACISSSISRGGGGGGGGGGASKVEISTPMLSVHAR